MSGLVSFFKNLIPLRDDHHKDDENHDSTNHYHTSLTVITPPKNPIVELDDDEHPNFTKKQLDYKMWKERRTRLLTKFLSKRVFRPEERIDDDSSSSSSSSSSDDDESSSDDDDSSSDEENDGNENDNDEEDEEHQDENLPESQEAVVRHVHDGDEERNQKPNQRKSIKQLCEFLKLYEFQREFHYRATREMLGDFGATDFYNMSLFLLDIIDNTNQRHKRRRSNKNRPTQNELYTILRDLGYPHSLSKDTIGSAGSPHVHPQLLQVLIWLMDYIKKQQQRQHRKARVRDTDMDMTETQDQEVQPRSFAPETQDQVMETPPRKGSKRNSPKKSQKLSSHSKSSPRHHRRRNKPSRVVPHHLDETTHSVVRLDELDLFAKDVTLDVCQMTLLGPLRRTKRLAVTNTIIQPLPIINGPHDAGLSRLVLRDREYDGPLSTIYKHEVIHLEVQQLLPKSPVPVPRDFSATATNHNHHNSDSFRSPARSRYTLKVFLYHQYAEALNKVLDNYIPDKFRVAIALENVPAISVFPYPQADWYHQQECLPYCLCIGGPSRLQCELNGEQERQSFDSDALRIRVAIFEKTNKKDADGDEEEEVEEWIIKKKELDVTARPSSKMVVAQRFDNWEQQWEEEVLPPSPPPAMNTTTNPASPARRDTETIPPAGVARKETQKSPPENMAGNKPAPASTTNTAKRKQPPPYNTNKENPVESVAATYPSNSRRGRSESPSRQPLPAATLRQRATSQRPAKRSKSSTTSRGYSYVTMNQLPAIYENSKRMSKDGEANLYGVVVGFSQPTRTRKGDFMLSVTLVDKSISMEDPYVYCSVPLLIFCKHSSDLPVFHRAGDILRLHRVVVGEFNEEIQLKGQRSTSYVVYQGNRANANEFNPQAIIAPTNYSLEAGDAEKFQSTWKWGQHRLTHLPTMKESVQRLLSDMKRQDDTSMVTGEDDTSHFDMTVMVVGVIPFPEQHRSLSMPSGWLRVWDGTGLSHSDMIPLHNTTDALRFNDPPSEALVEIAKIKECREGYPALTIPQRLCGRVANLCIWEPCCWDFINRSQIQAGSFIRLRNIHEFFQSDIGGSASSGMRYLHVTSKSWLTPLPPTTFEVLDLLAKHGGRVANNDPFNPNSGVLPLEIANELGLTPQKQPSVPLQSTTSPRHPPQHSAEAPPHREQQAAAPAPPAPPTPKQSKKSKIGGDSGVCTELHQLPNRPLGSVFEGPVYLDNIVPSVDCVEDIKSICKNRRGKTAFRFAVCLSSGAFQLPGLVTKRAGEHIFGMSASEAASKPEKAFKALKNSMGRQRNITLKSQGNADEMFFLIQSISSPDATS